jgi:hypothetical protein
MLDFACQPARRSLTWSGFEDFAVGFMPPGAPGSRPDQKVVARGTNGNFRF